MQILPRSKRVALPISISYRVPGDEEWFHSRVFNISESGVLFGPAELARGAQVEVIFATPTQIGSLGAGRQICMGEVVRTDYLGAAARFEECRFLLDG
jgi:hypothetical protein